MIAGRPLEILRQLEEREHTDRELLDRFVREHDQAAFAEIVRSHGSVVLGICRRMTGHPQDAEDAFQAVFLSLAQQATTIRNPDVLGGWIYSVAVRVAKKVRRTAIRRRAREMAVSPMPEPMTLQSESSPEVNPVLDEELAALPSWYRDAIVLCDVRGLSREKAAKALGVPEGTLSSRLANGRKKLAKRLTKRGITLSVSVIPTTFSSTQAAMVPTELIVKTCGLVADWMAGGTIPQPLAKLTEGGMTMRKFFMVGLFTTALAITGVVYATHTPENPTSTNQPTALPVVQKTEVAEQPLADAKPGDKQVAFTKTPKLRETLDLAVHGQLSMQWNPQGTRLAIVGQLFLTTLQPKGLQAAQANNIEKKEQNVVYVASVANDDPFKIATLANVPLYSQYKDSFVGFTPDGNQVLTEHREYQLLSGVHKLHFWADEGKAFGAPPGPGTNGVVPARMLMAGRLNNVQSIDLNPEETYGCYFAANGKTFRKIGIERDPTTRKDIKLHVLEVDATTGKQLKTLLTVDAGIYAMSQDGKRLAVFGKENTSYTDDGKKTALPWQEHTVEVYDVDRANKLFSYKVKSEVKKSDAPAAQANLQGEQLLAGEFAPWMTFSSDNRRLFVSSGLGLYRFIAHPKARNYDLLLISGGLGNCVVLNTESGQRLPALENADCISCTFEKNAFSADGRLIALSGVRYGISRKKLILTSNIINDEFVKKFNQLEPIVLESPQDFLTVWDTETGKVLKSWDKNPYAAFNPMRPTLAVLEPNENETRLGLWDFSADVADKK